MIINEALSFSTSNQVTTVNESKTNDTLLKPSCSLWADFDELVSKQQTKQNSKKLEIEIELKKLKSLPNLSRKENPLEWWENTGKTLFPSLYITAIKYLIIPATSVPSERIFSVAGSILTKKRNRLGAKNVNTILKLNSNIDLI